MINVESNELFDSIKKEIESRIEKAKKSLESRQEKLNNPNRKVGFMDKMFINSEIKKYQEEIRKLTELGQSVAELRFEDNKKVKLSPEIKENFDRLGTLLTEEEIGQLRTGVNDSLKNINKEKKDKVKQDVAKIQKLLNQLGLGTKGFLIYNGLQYTGTTTTFDNAIREAEKIQLKDLISEYSFIKSSPNDEVRLSVSNELMLKKLEEMINGKQLESNKNTENIINNFDSIKEAFSVQAKCSETLLVLSNTLSSLSNITEIDFSKVQLFLKQLESKYKKELEKTDKFLSKFNFEDIKQQIEKESAKEQQENLVNGKILNYQQLAYELEKVMTETPSNYDKIEQIKEAMRNMAISSGLTNDELEKAMINGKNKYIGESHEQQVKVDKAKEKVAYEDELKAGVMAEIREYAIRELESSGAFKDDYEFRNGDVYSKPMDKEAMIQRKIEELKKIAEMTPEERGLEDLKKQGAIRLDTRLEDLTPQQINDFRVAYRDESYSFMADYKQWKSRETVKPQANTIYKEYIKYRATLADKTQFLSFKDYAQQLHNIENMSEIMVDEELKEEMKGIAR